VGDGGRWWSGLLTWYAAAARRLLAPLAVRWRRSLFVGATRHSLAPVVVGVGCDELGGGGGG
jgi:hypothetical protein